MSLGWSLDTELMDRLPLPLAQLYLRSHNAKSVEGRHYAAFYFWEAGLKLLGCVAVVEYADLNVSSPDLEESLRNLARPSLGHWWQLVRQLVPVLADQGDESFIAARDLLQGRPRHDMPATAGLDVALTSGADEERGPTRSTVRLSELFDRLVRYRNQQIGHGVVGAHGPQFYERMAATLLQAVAELYQKLDVLAGWRLIYVSDVRRLPSGAWRVDRFELVGKSPQRLAPLELFESRTNRLPHTGRLYLGAREEASEAATEIGKLRMLHPLAVFDPDGNEVLFLNGRKRKKAPEYLGYSSGAHQHRVVPSEHRELLVRVLGLDVDPETIEVTRDGTTEETESAPRMPLPDRRCLGEFELISTIGVGGMGKVYRAWQPSLGRQVAVKKCTRSGDAKSRVRFAREIRALGRVDHPHLVKIFSSGSDADDYFYAMELVNGANLDDVCNQLAGQQPTEVDAERWQAAISTACDAKRTQEVPLSDGDDAASAAERAELAPAKAFGAIGQPVEHAVELICQVAEAAHALHEAGVVHRDIKPGNIMLTPDNRAVLMDLGLARMTDEGRLTRTRQFVGTLRYASPEQVLAVDSVDRRSDIYGLGATLWELLTLQPIFGATAETSDTELMKRIQFDEPQPVRAYDRRVSPDLEAIILKCLEKNPDRRYATAGELLDDLRRWQRGEPVTARRRTPLYVAVRWARRYRGWVASTVAAVLLLTAGCLAYWDGFVRQHVAYYRDVRFKFDVAEGVDRIPARQVQGRHFTYKIYRQGRWGSVRRFDVVDSSGELSPHGEISASIEDVDYEEPGWEIKKVARIDYEPQRVEGEVRYAEKAYNYRHDFLWGFVFSKPNRGHFIDEEGWPMPQAESGAEYINVTFTPEGLAREQRFTDHEKRPKPDRFGSYGHRAIYDDAGRTCGWINLGPDGEPALHRNGFVSFRREFDDEGREKRRIFLDERGEPVITSDGIAGWEIQAYDDFGNYKKAVFLETSLKPAAHGNGNLGWIREYDQGRLIEQTHFGYDERVFGFTQHAIVFDEHGHVIEGKYVGSHGNLALHKTERIAGWHSEFDERGRETRRSFFNAQRQPTVSFEQLAGWKSKHDSQGREIRRTFLGPDGERKRHRDGNYGWFAEYDKGRITRRTYFGYDGSLGFHQLENTLDENGNEIEGWYLDDAGERVVHVKEGIAGWRSQFDDQNRELRRTYLGPDGEPKRHPDGNYGWIAEYDKGRITRRTYFGFDGSRGFHQLEKTLDEDGNEIEGWYLDDAGERVVHLKEGIAGWRSEFDEQGREIRREFFDLDGNPTLNSEKIAGWQSGFDEQGRETRRTFFDVAGESARIHPEAYRGWTAEYQDGRLARKTYIGYDDSRGFTRIETHLDEAGRIQELWYMDDQGALVVHAEEEIAGWRSTYKKNGNEVRQEFLGDDRRPTLNALGGYSSWQARYEQGKLVGKTYYDLNGQEVATRVFIAQVLPETQAQEIGLQPGDIVLEYNGRPGTASELVDEIQRVQQEANDQQVNVSMKVHRNGEELSFQLGAGWIGVELRDVAAHTVAKPILEKPRSDAEVQAVPNLDEN